MNRSKLELFKLLIDILSNTSVARPDVCCVSINLDGRAGAGTISTE
jgi:hypothetical protein